MDAVALLQKVRRIEIKTRRLSDQLFSGEYQSSFKGRGMSFAEVRPYQSGDDVRSIDWNVTARKRSPYIKVFEEERELTLFLVIDISGSTNFGTDERSKRDMITEIAATLAFSAMGNNDKIGLILFSGKVEKVIPPKKGKLHVMRIIKSILETEATTQGTDVEGALAHLLKVQKRHSIVFVLSDYLDSAPDRNFKIAAKRFDLCAINTFNAKEVALPKIGLVPLADSETGAVQWVRSGGRKFRETLAKRHENYSIFLKNFTRSAGAGYISLDDRQDFVPPLLQFLKNKAR
ncbi:MAG: DUF58 domain-containing protein [Schleiferiaceae bacterium]|nr:DUF58 domain-containing protein [Schleiferiaceae bacterium]